MKVKVGFIIGAVIVFLAGLLVGELLGGGLGGGPKLKSGMTLEAKLAEIDSKLGEIQESAKGGGGGKLEEGKEYKFDLEQSPVLGNPNAKVKLVIWSDLQCPYCERVEGVLEELVKSNPDKYALYFKTKIIHPKAVIEHEATYSAQAQGKFWELNDLLFQNRREMIKLSQGDEEAYKNRIYELAGQAGVSIDQLKAELESRKYMPRLEEEDKEAKDNNIQSTPSVFINGYFYGYNPDEIKAKAQEILENPAAGKPQAKAEGLEATVAGIDQKLEELKTLCGRAKPQPAQQPRGPEQGKLFSFELAEAPTMGPKDAKVKLVIFSDFLCPYCKNMAQFLEDLQKQNPGQVSVTYKNFVVHPQARLEHEAAMAANAQGKFWQMHDLLYENQKAIGQLVKADESGTLTPESIAAIKAKVLELAKQAGLNMSQLQSDLEKKRL